MKRLQNFLNNHVLLIGGIMLAGIVASLLEGVTLSLIFPLFQAVNASGTAMPAPFPLSVVSQFFDSMDTLTRFRFVAVAMVIATILKGCMIYLSNVGTFRLQVGVVKYYRVLCFEQLMRVGISFINQGRQAHFQSIIVSMTEIIGGMVTTVGMLIPKLLTMAVLLAVLLMISWKMTLLAFCLVVVASLLLYRLVRASEQIGKRHTQNIKDLNDVVLSAILGMKVIRLFNREASVTGNFSAEADRYNDNLLKLVKVRSSMQPFFETIGIICLASILVIGSMFFVDSKTIGLEVILTFCVMFFRMLQPAMALNQARVDIKSSMPAFKEVGAFLDNHDKKHVPNGSAGIQTLSTGIQWRKVSFQYQEGRPVVLNDINLDITRGQKIGIVGPSGSGKSTISELLLRFYDPQEGGIFVDGKDLKSYDLHAWRRMIGVVSQDVFLFHDTVAANIAFANPDVSQEEIEKAAKNAHAHEFIMQLPNGYQTRIGDRGVLISGGQRQRMAIARAILNQPAILIFDEATSALDTESEKIVQEAIDEVGKNKTVITIAHRLSTLKDSDVIVVMDKGQIVEQGRHQHLMDLNGLYRRLVQQQTMEDVEVKTNG